MDNNDEPTHKRLPTDHTYFIAKEILTTERTYLKDLEVLTVWFRSAVVREDAMPEDLRTLLFSSIDPVYELHRGFLRRLEQRLALWEGPPSGTPTHGGPLRIGDILLRNMQQLQEFSGCFQRHAEVLTALDKATRCSKKLEAVCKDFELQKVCYLPLSAFLLKPAQRLAHYRLLLTRLCSQLPPGHPDLPDCQDALIATTEVTSALKPSLVRLGNLQKLRELQRNLAGIEGLVVPGRVEESRQEWSVPHCFTIYTAQKTVLVAASTRLEMEKWLGDLSSAIEAAKKGGPSPALPTSPACARTPRPTDEATTEQESEDDIQVAHGSLEGLGQHRANTTLHVCWFRNTSVSRAELSAAAENQLSGYLLRKFKNSSGWQKLWVVFTNFCLFFYKTHQDDYPLASLPLLGYSISRPEEVDSVHEERVFKLQFKSHVYYFRAESEYALER